MTPALASTRVAVIGLGYVGLPLAVEFGKCYPTVGFDINTKRVEALQQGKDDTLEVEPSLLAEARYLNFSTQLSEIANCNTYVVTVPTPIDNAKRPDLTPLIKASESIGAVLKPGDTVIYESTVYPGCTEDVCVPVLERVSGLMCETRGGSVGTFAVGYSPERINPGDKTRRITAIKKVTSGATEQTAAYVDALYASIVTAGTHKAPSIKVAEAAKVIENTQRDLNIALINDLAILFNKLGIDTLDVLEAAGTKWNFLPFRPGLVGGHCIGVDPYYLTYKAQEVGHHPQVILAGRRTNDGMGDYVANQVIKLMVLKRINPVSARVLVLGLAFKENCPDFRNTRVMDIVRGLQGYDVQVDVHDPWVNADDAYKEYGVSLISTPASGRYDAVVVAVGHRQFVELGVDGVQALGKPLAVLYDVKSVFPKECVDGRL